MENSSKNIPQKSDIPKNNSGVKASPAGGFESLIDDLNIPGISPAGSPREIDYSVNPINNPQFNLNTQPYNFNTPTNFNNAVNNNNIPKNWDPRPYVANSPIKKIDKTNVVNN